MRSDIEFTLPDHGRPDQARFDVDPPDLANSLSKVDVFVDTLCAEGPADEHARQRRTG